MKKINAISLFSSAGIGELLLSNTNVNVLLANEIIPKRADCYSYLHSDSKMICGDIKKDEIKKEIISFGKENNIKMLIATPPCQGFSTVGKNKKQNSYEKDNRNYLVFETFPIIDELDLDFVLIENVPNFLEMIFFYNNEYLTIDKILQKKYGEKYNVEAKVLNAKDYGICQSRPRCIIKMYKKGLNWGWPKTEEEIPLEKAIGNLPSLESGEISDIPYHYAKKENDRIVLAMKHTPTGKSAINNEIYYPKKENGERIKGFHNTFKRMDWDKPCPARTTYCGSMSSHNNVHPGRLLDDGTYSDARALTLYETFIVSSIPVSTKFPSDVSDSFIRTVIGESVPPLLVEKIIKEIEVSNNAYNGSEK